MKVDKYGSQGDRVKQLQDFLKRAGYDPGNSDGIFGKNTQKAVKAFQKAKGLKSDGKVGSKTRGAIDAFDRSPRQPQTPTRQPSEGPMRPGGSERPANPPPAATPPPATQPANPPPATTPPPVSSTGAVTSNPTPGATPPPPKYFAFASPSDKAGHSNGLNQGEVKSIIDRYGSNVMLGFDRGSFSDSDLKAMQQGRTGDIQNGALKYAVEHGARLHAYVEGPGGATGEAWSSDEKARIRAAAASVGIHVNDPSNARDPGTQAWKDHGWKDYAHKQLGELKKAGFDSVEIDNLDSASRVRNDPQGTVNFLKEYSQWWKNGEVPRILPKNFEEGQWNAVNAAVKNGTLPRGMFTDYAISEKGVGADRDEQARLAAKIGIQLIKSNDTNNYDAFGAYSVRS